MNLVPVQARRARTGAFTMVEIALCIGIIGFALVAIIGILPTGLRVQQENREDTLVNQDAQYLLEAIRSGSTNFGASANVLAAYVDSVRTGGNTYSNFTTDREVIGLLSRPTTNDAYIRNISGNAADLGLTATAKNFAFTYRLFVQVLPVVRSVTLPGPKTVLVTNHHELTLDFHWPVLPNGGTGSGRKTFRTLVAGSLREEPPAYFFFTPQTFAP